MSFFFRAMSFVQMDNITLMPIHHMRPKREKHSTTQWNAKVSVSNKNLNNFSLCAAARRCLARHHCKGSEIHTERIKKNHELITNNEHCNKNLIFYKIEKKRNVPSLSAWKRDARVNATAEKRKRKKIILNYSALCKNKAERPGKKRVASELRQ